MSKPIIMFDMDGTLLDLSYDNFLWNNHIPLCYAQQHQLPLEVAHQYLNELYVQYRHTLFWYSTQFWSEKLELDIMQIHHHFAHKIKLRSGCLTLLSELKDKGYECWLVTNADLKNLSLKLELTPLRPYFKHIISSESLKYPKEDPLFWTKLHHLYPFCKSKSVFIDDTHQVLKTAQNFGLNKLFTITQPSSEDLPNHQSHFPVLHHLTDLMLHL